MQRKLTGTFFYPAITILVFALPVFAQPQNRIVQALAASEAQPLPDNVHRLARSRYDRGQAAATMMLYRMVLTFKPTATQQAELEALLAEQQNPVSPYYHQWLTPEQYAARFALNETDAAQVVQWLESRGFTVDEVARSRTYVAFSGAVRQVESVFGTPIHRYLVNGDLHYANVGSPSLPSPLANVVLAFHGLNDFRPKPRAIIRRSTRPEFTSNVSGNHFLAPDDLATIYNVRPLYNTGIDGTGQSLAVMGQTDLVMSDISTFRSVSGLPANTPTVKLVPGSADPGVVKDDLGEADLDVEWAGAVARNASIIYVNSKNGAFDSMQYAVSQNLAPVISISYGDCEANFSSSEISSLVSMGQQANAQGQTIVGPSGDSGAADCDYPASSSSALKSVTHGLAVDIPAALPYATGVGGTTFNEGSGSFWSTNNNSANGSAQSYIPETSWNDTATEIAQSGGSIAASGGGVSRLFAKPTWQTGPGVPADGQRDVPDLSFSASFDHDGYLVCSNGSCVNGYRASDNSLFVVGGTSAGAPVFAGMVTLLNQQMQGAQGNVNPRLYQLAASSTDVFHDTTSGDNKVPCTAGTPDCPSGTTQIGFSAAPGYDLVTGLGSVDAFNLVTEWSTSAPTPADFQLSLSSSSMSLTAGTTANVGTTGLVISAVHGFAGPVALTCSVPASLPGTTCAVSPTSITTSGNATVTITAPATHAALLAPHNFPRFFPWSGGSLALAVGVVITGNRGRRSKKKRTALALLAAVAVIALALMTSCGGGGASTSNTLVSSNPASSGGSTAVSGTVTVQATSGALTHSASISVTVQ